MSGGKPLSAEDRILWTRVARSTRPLPGKNHDEPEREEESFEQLFEPKRATDMPGHGKPQETQRPRQPELRQHGIEAPTREKIAKGRLPIEGKVDLHGLTQSEAHGLLLSFLHRAYADGRRHVLVVTGKGSSLGSEGVLKRAVPAWLATPPFRPLVAGHEQAARHHGGSGALYVRIRRPASGGR